MAILLPDCIDVTTFGEFLRDAREKRGLTIQQIASETRIPWRHLEALEHGNLDAVPGGVYRRAEIRAYADAVGLDRTLALTQFEHAVESSNPQPHAAVEAPPSNGGLRMSWTALGAVGVVAAATIFAVSLRGGDGTDTGAPPASVTPAQATPPVAPAASPTLTRPAGVIAPAAVPAAIDATAALATPSVPVASAALTITSDPPGARVLVDGIGRGATPLTVKYLSGATRIRVIKDGYISKERDVRINDRPVTLHVALDAVH
jgi:transcriptional regulator with XRE-family HTH domain